MFMAADESRWKVLPGARQGAACSMREAMTRDAHARGRVRACAAMRKVRARRTYLWQPRQTRCVHCPRSALSITSLQQQQICRQ